MPKKAKAKRPKTNNPLYSNLPFSRPEALTPAGKAIFLTPLKVETLMLKNALFCLIFIPVTCLIATWLIISAPFKPAKINKAITIIWGRMTLALAGVAVQADMNLMSKPSGRGRVIMANHKNLFDIPLLFALLKNVSFVFVAKKSLFKIPFFGWAMSASGHISIDRANRRKAMDSIKEAQARLDQGISILIFPEGTRSQKADSLGKFQMGGIIMAIESKCEMQPIVIDGTINIMAPGSLALTPGQHVVKVRTLAALCASNYTMKERERLKELLSENMSAAFEEMRNAG